MDEGILICRVSSPRQEDKFSLDAQEREGKAYAAQHGIRLVESHVFMETASKAGERKKFDAILGTVYGRSAGKPLALLAEKHDRLYRNHQSSADVQRLIESGRAVVHFWKLGKVLDKHSDPSEFLVDDVMTSVNQYHARRIGREALKGMTERALQGWMPAKAPLGYRNLSQTTEGKRSGRAARESTIVPDPATVPWARRIFELRAAGYSFGQIRERCIAEGFVPTERLHSFRPNVIEQIIKNPFYTGRFNFRGQDYQGKHELIVDPDTVHLAVNLDVRSTRRKCKKEGALTGWLSCTDCGCRITYDPKKKRARTYEYYRCANGRHAHARLVYATDETILSCFEPALDAICLSAERAQEVAAELNRSHNKTRELAREQIDGYQAALAALDNREDGLYDDHRRGILDAPAYSRQLERLRTDRQRYATLVAQAKTELDGTYLVTGKRILELSTSAKTLWNRRTGLQRREFLDKLLSNPRWDGASACWDYKKPWETVVQINQSSNWRARKDLNLRPLDS